MLSAWLKRVVVAAARRLPPRAVRRLPASGVRAFLLTMLGRVLEAEPISFRRAKTPFGFAITGTTADLLQRQVYVFGIWEPNISRWVQGYLRPADVVVDIGANVGYFSLLCASRVGPEGRVIAFEPVPSLVAVLRDNLALNGADSVTVQPVIASDEPGTGEIFSGPDGNLGLSTTSPAEGFTSQGNVRKVRAADIIDRELWPRVKLVKVDTEGDDLRALRGLEPLLDAMPPGSSALVEVSPDDLLARGHTPDALVSFMRDAGFHRMLAIDNSYEESAYARDRPQAPVPLLEVPSAKADVIFVKGDGMPHASS